MQRLNLYLGGPLRILLYYWGGRGVSNRVTRTPSRDYNVRNVKISKVYSIHQCGGGFTGQIWKYVPTQKQKRGINILRSQ